jgi:hypothetical protein
MCVYIVDIEDQFKFSFPSHMLMEELDAQRSDLLSLTRVNSTNALDEGLRIGEIGHRMNSKVRFSRNRCVSKVNLGVQPGLLSICPPPSPPGPYI